MRVWEPFRLFVEALGPETEGLWPYLIEGDYRRENMCYRSEYDSRANPDRAVVLPSLV